MILPSLKSLAAGNLVISSMNCSFLVARVALDHANHIIKLKYRLVRKISHANIPGGNLGAIYSQKLRIQKEFDQ
jgi:hypothetical protein